MTAAMTASSPPAVAVRVSRIEVRPIAGEIDPHAQRLLPEAQRCFSDLQAIHTTQLYLIEAPLTDDQRRRIAEELLADPVNQQAQLDAAPVSNDAALIEVHYKPGVMDPIAQSTREAIVEMIPQLALGEVDVRTGVRYDLDGVDGQQVGQDALAAFAERYLANPVIQDIHTRPHLPDAFSHGRPYPFKLTHVSLRQLDDEALAKLSREAHLFLSIAEMRAVRDYFRQLDREPTDIEMETLAQTWSEHCVHKTLKSKIRYCEMDSQIDFRNRPGHTVHEDGSVTIDNLFKSTIAAATHTLMQQPPHNQHCISVFVDNAGIVRFDETDALCIKVETHNHPSAIEPYGGAATGVGGCIRDVMGAGLSARPIANTDVFAVANPDTPDVPKGVIHPRRILEQVVAGVRDYGNRMGIPTVNGAVVFHPGYLANPLVFVGCVGMLPLDKCFGDAQPGDRIIALGGATGRDGIHGATFSSAELTDTHADEFSHAVQIGNAITQKKTMDVILQARDHADGCLFHAITDCGAGGFSSAVGEMGEKVGAHVQLENAPLKYPGLSYTEIWISEAQERMVLAVPAKHVEPLRNLCQDEDVGFCDLGQFGAPAPAPEGGGAENSEPNEAQLVLTYHGNEVGRLSMSFLHDGAPTLTREAQWSCSPAPTVAESPEQDAPVAQTLHALLAHPDIASKHWIIRQYDHEVQGASAVKPLVGAHQDGPSDAAVIRPKLNSDRGAAIACGLAPNLGDPDQNGDPYWMTLTAVDEAVRNIVCVGADAKRITLLDNFCWPSCDNPRQLGALVRSAEACYDGALAYGAPFVSGKDSLNNQFTTEDGRLIAVPPTLLITALGVVDDVKRCRTMDAKAPSNLLLIVGDTGAQLGGSHFAMVTDQKNHSPIPHVDLQMGPNNAAAVAQLIADGRVQSAHDCSEGGLLVAAAEMAFAGRIGLDLDVEGLPMQDELSLQAACFAQTPSRYLLEIKPADLDAVVRCLRELGASFGQIGAFAEHDRLTLRTPRDGRVLDEPLDDLLQSWRAPLDW